MNISVGEGVEDLDDEGVNREGVESSLSPPTQPMNFGLLPLNEGIDRELLSTGEKGLNLKGGENVPLSLDSFWMLLVGVPGGVGFKAAGGWGVKSKYPRR